MFRGLGLRVSECLVEVFVATSFLCKGLEGAIGICLQGSQLVSKVQAAFYLGSVACLRFLNDVSVIFFVLSFLFFFLGGGGGVVALNPKPMNPKPLNPEP